MSLKVQVPQDMYKMLMENHNQLQTKTKTTKIDVAHVASQVNLIDLALEYGLDLIEQTGGDYICLCPFHDDYETPSMRIYTITNTWHCTSPDTKVLMSDMRWKNMGDLIVGDNILSIDEEIQSGSHYRKIRQGTILRTRQNKARCLKVSTTLGDIVVSEDHKFLCKTGGGIKWKNLKYRKDKRYKLPQGIKKFFAPDLFEEDFAYKLGYFMGYFEGDGSFRYTPGQSSYPKDSACWFTIASKDIEGITYIKEFLNSLDIYTRIVPHYYKDFYDKSIRRTIQKIDTRKLSECAKIYNIIHNVCNDYIKLKNYKRGWIAGIFDAEGTHGRQTSTHGGSLGIYNSDLDILNRCQEYLKDFEFTTVLRKSGKQKNKKVQFIGIKGGVLQRTRFLSAFQPKILRKHLTAVVDTGICNFGKIAQIKEITPIGFHDIIEIETSTKTIITNGLVSHNCFGCQKGSSVFDFVMFYDKVEFSGALLSLAAKVGYGGTYVLQKIKDNKEIERFSLQREKIELAISKKYNYIYTKLIKLESNNQNEVYKKLQDFWKYYDNAQNLFNQKSWESVDAELLESKLYEFYSKVLARLEGLV